MQRKILNFTTLLFYELDIKINELEQLFLIHFFGFLHHPFPQTEIIVRLNCLRKTKNHTVVLLFSGRLFVFFLGPVFFSLPLC